MAVLGVEGTAHTVGVGVVEAAPGRPDRCVVLANERAMARPEEGGIHPRVAAEHHAAQGPDVLRRALDAAGLAPGDLEAVAFSQGPGLGPCLRVAATMARAFALRHGLPLVGVNHCVAHLEIGRGMTDARDPLLLYASGGNTQVIALARGRYRVFGETLDIGLGNALDKFARDHGIPFPGGPRVEAAARAWQAHDATGLAQDARGAAGSGGTRPGTAGGGTGPDPAGADGRGGAAAALFDLPYTVKGMDLGFSGLVTAAARRVADGAPFDAVCHAFQETAFAALLEVAERALAHAQKDELLLGGGVACNARLQEMARAMVEARGGTFHCPPRDVLVDNGAMIAWNGLLRRRAGQATPVEQSAVRPYWRTDEVEVDWR